MERVGFMKIISLIVLAFLMMCAAMGEGATFDFEDGMNPGFAQSGSCVIAVNQHTEGNYSLSIGKRSQNDWDAADLSPAKAGIALGDTVKISFKAYQSSGKTGTIALAYAGGSYGILASAAFPSGKWVDVEGIFDYSEEQNLRFKVDDALANEEYRLDDIRITVLHAEENDKKQALDYQSDFSAGTDGWYARSAGTASISAQDGALTITGREATWNSPGRDFPLIAGTTYQVGVYVRQDAVDKADFMISAAHFRGGTESYENIVKATARKGEWTYLGATYVPGLYDNYVLYVETSNNGTIPFSMRDFFVNCNEVTYPMDLSSLKELYAPYFVVGTAVTQSEALNKERMDFYASQFGIVTAGNELKPDFVFDVGASRRAAKTDETAVVIKLDAAKPMLTYCYNHGIPVHGHTLLWHQQTPETFFLLGYSTSKGYASREIMLGRMENYIKLVMEETEKLYPGLIVSWDVVNEAINDNNGGLRDGLWRQTVGDDYILKAFEFARKYAREGVILCYNDYSTPYQPKLNGILKLLTDLTAQGNIDCYGFQSHYQLGSPSIKQVDDAMTSIANLGLKLRVSEMDITIDTYTPEMLEKQAKRYAELFDLYMRHADDILAVQLWGVTDDLSWLSGQYPLLFDRLAQPKPAFEALIAQIAQ